MDANLVIEITNGVIILVTSLILMGVRSVVHWIKSVDDRLDKLEKELEDDD
jgi:hypothetical protein